MEEPYKVIEVLKGDEVLYIFDAKEQLIKRSPPGFFWFSVTYRNYSRRACFNVRAKDELEAYMRAQKRIDEIKNHYDKYGRKKKEQTS